MIKKITELSVKKKIILALIVVSIITMFAGIVFASFNTNSKAEDSKKLKEKETKHEIKSITSSSEIEPAEEENLMIVIDNEEATQEELDKGKVKKINNITQYYIVVNYSTNVVTIYGKDENNAYTVPVKAMVCSTGTATPKSGVYSLPGTKSKWGLLFGNVYGQYTTKIVGNILFHSVPYEKRDNSTLEYWEYDKLGTSASAGCVRLRVSDALWIYNNCGRGTQVEFTASHQDPLGKPTAMKISGYPDLRGYDPTDPATNNPWKNASISVNEIPMDNEDENNNQTNTTNTNNTNSTNRPNTSNRPNSNNSNKGNQTNNNTTNKENNTDSDDDENTENKDDTNTENKPSTDENDNTGKDNNNDDESKDNTGNESNNNNSTGEDNKTEQPGGDNNTTPEPTDTPNPGENIPETPTPEPTAGNE